MKMNGRTLLHGVRYGDIYGQVQFLCVGLSITFRMLHVPEGNNGIALLLQLIPCVQTFNLPLTDQGTAFTGMGGTIFQEDDVFDF